MTVVCAVTSARMTGTYLTWPDLVSSPPILGIKLKQCFFCFNFRNFARKPSGDKKKKTKKTKPQKGDEPISAAKSEEETFSWRIFYASIPFQLLLLAAIFFAWTYEPKCCEATNNSSYGLLPQLRYMYGPPPI